MKIKELELNNFRGFEHLKIQFPENNLAVFIGTNGSGKSSVLDALGMLFTQFVYKLNSKSFNKEINIPSSAFQLSKNDIRKGLVNSAHTNLQVNYKDQLWNWAVSKSVDGKLVNRHSDQNGLDDLVHSISLDSQEPVPLVVYYQTHRTLHSDKKVDWLSIKTPQLVAYVGGFVPKLSKFNDFVLWFKETVDEENAEKIARESFRYRDERLEAVRAALEGVLNVMQTARYMNLHIVRPRDNTFSFEHINKDFILAINKNGQDFDINQLSDGEKTLIMLVCDIARRLTIANPALENKLEGEGVVMIDEIELHLHPAWQRNVLPALQQTFPNIQFIVTTHSPHVLNNVDARNIFLFRNENNQITCEQPDSTLGRDVNWILEEVMGVSVRPKGFDSVWGEVQELISVGGKENLQKAKQHIEKLLKDFELADDGELNAKLAIIKRKEVLGR